MMASDEHVQEFANIAEAINALIDATRKITVNLKRVVASQAQKQREEQAISPEGLAWRGFLDEHPELEEPAARPSDEAIVDALRRIVTDTDRLPHVQGAAMASDVLRDLYPSATLKSHSERGYIGNRLGHLAKQGQIVRLRPRSPSGGTCRWTFAGVELGERVKRYWEAG
jgi:hypothetical protein